MSDSLILQEVKSAFGGIKRPELLVVDDGDFEAHAHATMWNNKDVGTLTFEDVFREGEYPYQYLTSEGLKYFLPTFVEIILNSKEKKVDGEWCGVPFVAGVFAQVPNRLLPICSTDQKKVISKLLEYFKSLKDLISDEDMYIFDQASKQWSS